MPEFVFGFSSVSLFIFLIVVLISISFLAITLLRRHLPLHFRYQENTAIVSCSAFLGVTYAILIGFTILYQLNVFDKADKAETIEGKALYSIYRNTRILPEPSATKIRNLTLAYARNAINKEWPEMNAGSAIEPTGKKLIEEIQHEINLLVNSHPSSPVILNALSNLSFATNNLFEVHNERVSKVHSTLNGHIWFVLLLTTLLTLCINYLLGMEYILHLACISLICIMIAAIMYLIIGLDRPYQGDFAVHPETISSTLEYITDGYGLPS